MGELRKDYILDRYVIIATERAKRPDQFKAAETKPENNELCYFCPGHEELTPQEIQRHPEGSKEWEIRVFPNKFPAVRPLGKSNIVTDNSFFTYSDSFGYHEVIVETPEHEKTLSDLSEERICQLFKIFSTRIEVNMTSSGIRYVSVFKNHGKSAGTSIQHTHCQLIAYNSIPEIILQKERAVKKHPGCPYCSILNIEKNSLRRCYENQYFVAFTPYASRFPFEIWVVPKRHLITLSQFSEQEFIYLAEIMKKITAKLKYLNADYNFYLQYGFENLHFHIEITPRLTTWAGFELSTGTIINTMAPESAAEFYRS